jgi:hypothetical protein
MGPRWARSLVCASLLLAAPIAHAAPSATDRARALAEEAGDLLDAKRYADALDRVTRAEALYHAPTNVLMIGEAQEGLGHLAAALETYERLAAEPLPPTAPRPFLQAQHDGKVRLDALLARVPSVLVTVHGLDEGQHADVRIDHEPLDARTAKHVDPGPHLVQVTAPGHEPFERSVDLPEKGGVVFVDATLAPLSGGAAAPPSWSLLGVADPRGLLVPALVAFGVGTVAAAIGTVTGIVSLSDAGNLRNQCPGNQCAPALKGEVDSTKTLGDVSTTAFVVGGVAAAAGGVLLLLVLRPNEASRAAALDPWVGPHGAGVEGVF